MEKMNVVLINRISAKHYRDEFNKFFLDSESYNVIIITKEDKLDGFHSHEYSEIHSIKSSNDEEISKIVREVNSRIAVQRVLSISEAHIIVCAALRAELGLPGIQPSEAISFRDKVVMKQALVKNKIRVPNFALLSNVEIAFDYLEKYQKIVIKPIDGMGSEDTFIIKNRNDLESCLKEIESKISNLNFEVEEFIEGYMVHIDSVIKDGKIVHCVASKYIGDPTKFRANRSIGSLMLPNGELFDAIKSYNLEVISALKLTNGVSHHEVFITANNEIVFCEIGARVGGASIVPMIKFNTGVNLIQASLCVELGMDIPTSKCDQTIGGYLNFYPQAGRVNQVSGPKIDSYDWLKEASIKTEISEVLNMASNGWDSIANFVFTARSVEEQQLNISTISNEFSLEVKA